MYTSLSYKWETLHKRNRFILVTTNLPKLEFFRGWSFNLPLEANCYEIFQVTTNLESGLRHLRDQTVKYVFWIHAICIDQSDVEGCRSEVGEMDDVYRNAVKVHIWLGSISDVSVSTP